MFILIVYRLCTIVFSNKIDEFSLTCILISGFGIQEVPIFLAVVKGSQGVFQPA